MKHLPIFALFISLFALQCSSMPRLGIDREALHEEGVHVILHPSLNLAHYNDIEISTANNPNTSHHFLIEPGEQVMGVNTAYSKKIWAFYSKIAKVTVNGKPDETYLICSRFIREKRKRPPTGGKVMIETKVTLHQLTQEQEKEIYIDNKIQVDYLRSICPVE